jgi:dTDP-4-dehydrorhamnose 3,5-epimerase-like enzyme
MMASNNIPYIVNFQTIGTTREGFLSIASTFDGIPFDIKRVFWTYETPINVIRGGHAHHKTEMVLIAIQGTIIVECEINSQLINFTLNSSAEGIYIPPFCWHTMKYSENSVQLVLASTDYDEDDYIRDYSKFLIL